MNRLNILVVDHSEIIRQGIAALLKTRPNHYQVSSTDNLREIGEQIRNGNLDILIANPTFYFDTKGEQIKMLRQEAIANDFKLAGLVYAYFDEQILSMFDEVIYINDDDEKIFQKLEKLLDSGANDDEAEESAALSQRELDVVRLVALGKSNREIAEELFISIHTVISHRKNITSKLGIKSVSGLTIYAVINKLIVAEDFGKTV